MCQVFMQLLSSRRTTTCARVFSITPAGWRTEFQTLPRRMNADNDVLPNKALMKSYMLNNDKARAKSKKVKPNTGEHLAVQPKDCCTFPTPRVQPSQWPSCPKTVAATPSHRSSSQSEKSKDISHKGNSPPLSTLTLDAQTISRTT